MWIITLSSCCWKKNELKTGVCSPTCKPTLSVKWSQWSFPVGSEGDSRALWMPRYFTNDVSYLRFLSSFNNWFLKVFAPPGHAPSSWSHSRSWDRGREKGGCSLLQGRELFQVQMWHFIPGIPLSLAARGAWCSCDLNAGGDRRGQSSCPIGSPQWFLLSYKILWPLRHSFRVFSSEGPGERVDNSVWAIRMAGKLIQCILSPQQWFNFT